MPNFYGTSSKKSLAAALAVGGIFIFLFIVGLGVMLWYYLRAKPSSQIDALYPRDVESVRTFIPSSTTAIACWNEKAPPTTTGSSEENLGSGGGAGEQLEAPRTVVSRHSSASDMSQSLSGLRPVEPVAVVR